MTRLQHSILMQLAILEVTIAQMKMLSSLSRAAQHDEHVKAHAIYELNKRGLHVSL